MSRKPTQSPSPSLMVDDEQHAVEQAVPEYLQEVETPVVQAEPRRQRRGPAEVQESIIARAIFVTVTTDVGSRGKMDMLALHEVPLLRRKIKLQEPGAGKPMATYEWPATVPRSRPLTARNLMEEMGRLRDRYIFEKPNGREGETVNLLADLYGNADALLHTIRKLEKGWLAIHASLAPGETVSDDQIEELLAHADMESAMMESTGVIAYAEAEPFGAGAVIGADGVEYRH